MYTSLAASDGLLNLHFLQLSFAHVLFDNRMGHNIIFSKRSLTLLLKLRKLCVGGKRSVKKVSKWSTCVLKQCLSITSSQHIRLMEPINYCKFTERFLFKVRLAFRRGAFKFSLLWKISHAVIGQSKTVKSLKKTNKRITLTITRLSVTLHHHSCPPLSSTAKLWKFLAIFKKFPNFVAHNILWGFQRDVMMAQACFDVTALHRVGEWHAESKLLKWEPHWEHVNLMLCFSYSIEANSQALASDMRGVHDQKFVSDKTGTQTVRGFFPGMFFIQSGCDSCWTCFSFSCGRVKAPARLLRLSCVWALYSWLVDVEKCFDAITSGVTP